jgi:nitrite reductase/ring-hydroxylating ferredoxin subunit
MSIDDATQFVKVGAVEDLAAVKYKKLRLMARHVAVFPDGEGGFFATEISCKHQNWDLTTGEFKGDEVTCPRHHWRYNIRTGECLNHDSTPLRRHAVKVEDGIVYISLMPVNTDLR